MAPYSTRLPSRGGAHTIKGDVAAAGWLRRHQNYALPGRSAAFPPRGRRRTSPAPGRLPSRHPAGSGSAIWLLWRRHLTPRPSCGALRRVAAVWPGTVRRRKSFPAHGRFGLARSGGWRPLGHGGRMRWSRRPRTWPPLRACRGGSRFARRYRPSLTCADRPGDCPTAEREWYGTRGPVRAGRTLCGWRLRLRPGRRCLPSQGPHRSRRPACRRSFWRAHRRA